MWRWNNYFNPFLSGSFWIITLIINLAEKQFTFSSNLSVLFLCIASRPIWTLTEIASTVSFVFKECTAYRFLLTILNLGELLIFKVIFHFETNMYTQVWIGLNVETWKKFCRNFFSNLYFTAACLGKGVGIATADDCVSMKLSVVLVKICNLPFWCNFYSCCYVNIITSPVIMLTLLFSTW